MDIVYIHTYDNCYTNFLTFRNYPFYCKIKCCVYIPFIFLSNILSPQSPKLSCRSLVLSAFLVNFGNVQGYFSDCHICGSGIYRVKIKDAVEYLMTHKTACHNKQALIPNVNSPKLEKFSCRVTSRNETTSIKNNKCYLFF